MKRFSAGFSSVKGEPAAITGLAAAFLNAMVLFADLDLTGDQQGVIVTAITIIAGMFIRSKVTPVA